MIVNYVTDKNLGVCVSAPTGKLAARYKQQLPDCRCNIVHSNFTISVGTKDMEAINWSLSDVHALLIDEVPFTDFNCLLSSNISTFNC